MALRRRLRSVLPGTQASSHLPARELPWQLLLHYECFSPGEIVFPETEEVALDLTTRSATAEPAVTPSEHTIHGESATPAAPPANPVRAVASVAPDCGATRHRVPGPSRRRRRDGRWGSSRNGRSLAAPVRCPSFPRSMGPG